MELKSLEFVRVNLADNIAEVTLSRPKALNALNRQVLEELNAALTELEGIESLACVILTGEGDRAFVAGADIAEMSDMQPDAALAFATYGQATFDRVAAFPVPVLAAVNGYALGGGCELALACDVIYASERAKLGQPEVKLGLIPGFGGSVRLARKIGLAAASEWIYTGDVYGAQVACGFGTLFEALSKSGISGSDNVLVTGLGPVGLATAMLSRALGARKIIVALNIMKIMAFRVIFSIPLFAVRK